ncbi:dihydrolipoamide acetyltransferase family protein [Parendozoicomonas haliclonae]|uniref:Dihydrolipoamide acetyltransferase component of pyruvate dehydrogenase complex n=1 Tax=Parendozoicomonas haliclonae TaxID=1960125 RepID=A0A1X7AQ99_9GAMM|nr:dihydrolipoamide acetyltransferase family protein [Parendozoicomonas haliclonae]SMA50323.1 Dihydrolipoyllysine-residue acetyltransferase component of pyruvate dehydrogenase complex [Parendozoicomonas haliclonae]
MKYFKLPDLGEGIPEAEIVQWHVREGETVQEDQIIVSMETAKAVVDVPSPCEGVVIRQFGQPGDLIHTGESLVEFEGEDDDTGTVVGSIQDAGKTTANDDEQFFIGAAPSTDKARDIAVKRRITGGRALQSYELESGEPVRGVRREMLHSMARANHEVAAVTLFADADIHQWTDKQDLTVRVIQALVAAAQEVPVLNAWFDEQSEQIEVKGSVHLGLAVDSDHGLFVPIMRDAQNLGADEIREQINGLKAGVHQRKLGPEAFQGGTISVSNFGALGCGRYATPVVVPPSVAILGVGSVDDQVVAWNGQPAVHKVISLSLSFDHRAATGGEAARFLKTVVQHLELKNMTSHFQS